MLRVPHYDSGQRRLGSRRGDARNSSGVPLVVVNRLVKPTDLLEGYVEVENRW